MCSRRWTQAVISCSAKCPHLKSIVQLERLQFEEVEAAQVSGISLFDFDYVEKKGESHPILIRRPSPHDIATVTYTPSSNHPGGVALTHANLVASISAFDLMIEEKHDFTHMDIHCSFAPLAHMSERSSVLWALKRGMAIGFSRGLYGQIYDDMQVLQPTFLIGSFGIFESLYQRFMLIRSEWSILYNFLFELAFRRKINLLKKGIHGRTTQHSTAQHSTAQVYI